MISPTTLRSMSRFFLVVILALSCVARAMAGGWTRTEWRGEKAWAAVSAHGWTALVSEERARLVSLTPPGCDVNLLFADLKDKFSWGGHRFWLGPQTAWAVVWPPPVDWETSPAAVVEADGGVLRVSHPHTDKNYPRVSRTYEWRGRVLHCTASWSDARFQGIHILQVPTAAVVRVKRKVAESLPLGYVLLPIFRRPDVLTDREVSPAVARVEGDDIVLRYANVAEKIGVAPQEIVAEIGAHRLSLRRGRMDGMSATRPDLGMLTQVFLGSDESSFTEIEQLTPLGGPGEAVSEILLEPATPPAASK